MNNELRIKPLLRYTITDDDGKELVFTADGHSYDAESGMFRFFRTGNTIREINRLGVEQIVATPDEG